MNGWGKDKSWADQFMPHVEVLILRSVLCVSIGNTKEDQEENTDLRVYSVRLTDTSPSIRVAVRIRRLEYLNRYPFQVTFRSNRPVSGNATELEKMWGGFGDLFLYGFGDERTRRVAEWVVLDLRELRRARRLLACGPNEGEWQEWIPVWTGPITNGDGSSEFKALHLDRVPRRLRPQLIRTASSHYQEIPDPPQIPWRAAQLPLIPGGA